MHVFMHAKPQHGHDACMMGAPDRKSNACVAYRVVNLCKEANLQFGNIRAAASYAPTLQYSMRALRPAAARARYYLHAGSRADRRWLIVQAARLPCTAQFAQGHRACAPAPGPRTPLRRRTLSSGSTTPISHFPAQPHLGRRHGVVLGQEQLQLEHPSLVRRLLRAQDHDVEVPKVVFRGRGADSGRCMVRAKR